MTVHKPTHQKETNRKKRKIPPPEPATPEPKPSKRQKPNLETTTMTETPEGKKRKSAAHPEPTQGLKKRKKEKNAAEAATPVEPENPNDAPQPPRKKRKKQKTKPMVDPPKSQDQQASPQPPSEDAPTAPGKPRHRFIVFIGNLPFNTTAPLLTAHFAPVAPASVRLITSKVPPHPCKGYAFLEFADYDRMKSCLTRFHHGEFLGRKINVELTAGGGGAKSKGRREKLREKNERLDQQRRRRMEEKAREGKRAKGAHEQGDDGNTGLHPSRIRNVKT